VAPTVRSGRWSPTPPKSEQLRSTDQSHICLTFDTRRRRRAKIRTMDLLYKYRPLGTEHDSERTLQIIQEGKIWMATPSSFNDPFDCQPSILRNIETDQRNLARIVGNYLKKIKNALRTGASLADREFQPIPHRTLVALRRVLESRRTNEQKYQALKRHFVVPPDATTVFESLKESLARIGVLSLSANPTAMLMWAHYASQHTGICLGFERSEGSLLSSSVHTKPVNYVDDYPQIDLDSLEVSLSVSVNN